MKIFVSGATGHLGGKIIEFLAKNYQLGILSQGQQTPALKRRYV